VRQDRPGNAKDRSMGFLEQATGEMTRQTSGSTIRFERLTKRFGDVVAVSDVSFHVQKGEFLTLLGPSGSGKTTILNMVAGFEKPTEGNIYLDDRALTGIPPFKRNIGMVFQNYALFPHMTVSENIAFPLTTRRLPKSQIEAMVKEALALVKLQGFGNRYPKQLSGGQQQRVALARSLIFKPPVLLMDEPLGALDKKLREHMQLEIKHLHEELGFTAIYVTHDQSEALTMSDTVALLNLGRLEQLGRPAELYDKPRTRFVADFIGETNLLEGRIVGREEGLVHIRTPGGLQIKAVPKEDLEGEEVSISLRPEKVSLLDHGQQRQNSYRGTVGGIIYVGEATKLMILIEGKKEEVFLKLQNRKGVPTLSRGDSVMVGWDADDMTLF